MVSEIHAWIATAQDGSERILSAEHRGELFPMVSDVYDEAFSLGSIAEKLRLASHGLMVRVELRTFRGLAS